MDKNCTACFTGHRPEKLKSPKEEIVEKLTDSINLAILKGVNAFITGLAEGVDLWAGKIILEKKNNGEIIKLIAAMPFRNYSAQSPEFQEIMEGADEIVVVSDGDPDPEDDKSYIERDRWMVDNSDYIISVYEGQSGGTRNTIEYAIEKNKEVIYLYDRL